MAKAVPCTSASCQRNNKTSNVAAVDCVQSRCFGCCDAGASCAAHERKRAKVAEKAAYRRAKKGRRGANDNKQTG